MKLVPNWIILHGFSPQVRDLKLYWFTEFNSYNAKSFWSPGDIFCQLVIPTLWIYVLFLLYPASVICDAKLFLGLSHNKACGLCSQVEFDQLAESLVQLERKCKASWDHLKVIAKHETKPFLKNKMTEFLKDSTERIIILKVVHRRIINRSELHFQCSLCLPGLVFWWMKIYVNLQRINNWGFFHNLFPFIPLFLSSFATYVAWSWSRPFNFIFPWCTPT